jgi:hypothetical protein
MNKNLQSLFFSLAIVGSTLGEPLSNGDLPTVDIPTNTVDAGDQETCAQIDINTDLRSRNKVKNASDSESNGNRIGDLESDGTVAVGFVDFLECWLDRDLEGGGSDFTGGCWDRNMGRADEGTGGSDSKGRSRSARA